MIVPKHYEDLSVLHENKMPDRAYDIQASVETEQLVDHRERSDRFQSLNGIWRFRYYGSIYELQEEFYRTDFDADAFRQVPVPSVWQNYGCDSHQYTNYRYPFPADPPYVPADDPCGAYLLDFEYQRFKEAPRAYLNFEGVDSCFYLWLNGEYVGYSQVSHATHEFDITDHLREGTNRLAVLVLKWCDGSYMEDQDRFRMSGIFRDVYLLHRPENFIYDYFVRTNLDASGARIDLQIRYLHGSVPTTAVLYDPEGNFVEKVYFSDHMTFRIPDPVLWNSEEPNLYRLVLKTDRETITEQVGLREVHIENSILYVNGKKVKLRGVNRHESDPRTGFVVDIDHVKRDLTMIKKYNFNAIRTSHYPNVPYFYQLCDRYGFFVIDEADNESHGPWQLYYRKDTDVERAQRWNEMISDEPAFIEATLDRTKSMVQRDKNRPCVIIWSMGNECGYGCTFEEALKWTKAFDPGRLTHYESAYYKGRRRKYDYSNIDLYSRMYPAFRDVLEYVNAEPDKPFLMCEYCHSMGNGPGDFEDYYELIEKYDVICGGFVWEWCDHAIEHGSAPDGRKIWFYGGDHSELLHDGNFCMDGLVYPDRKPHTGLLEFRNVHRPGRVTAYDQEAGILTIRNEMNFLDLAEYADIRWEMTCDGTAIAAGSFSGDPSGDAAAADSAGSASAGFSIPPHQSADLALHLKVPGKGKCFLKVFYYSRQAHRLPERGCFLGFDEIPLLNEDGRNQTAAAMLTDCGIPAAPAAGTSATTSVTESVPASGRKTQSGHAACSIRECPDGRTVYIEGTDFHYHFDKCTGMFTRMTFAGTELLDRSMDLSIWRAPTDNDIRIREEWQKAFYDHAYVRAYSTGISADEDNGSVVLSCTLGMVAPSIQRILNIEALWRVFADGSVRISMHVQKDPEFPELPRFSLRLFLDRSLSRVTYCGLGPNESYPDKRRSDYHGIFKAEVQDLHEDYIRPQENGSHDDCDYVTVESQGRRLTAVSERPFSFNASLYTQEELTLKAHNYELIPDGCTVLNLDYRQDGIGSNSCGPRPQEKYLFSETEFDFDLKLIPE